MEWLQAHPGVEVVSRDRAPAYAEAARKGAPQAVQVADRWHVLQNLVEALERCLLRFRPALKAAAGMGDSLLGPLPSSERGRLGPLAAAGGSCQSAEARQQGGAVRADADAPGCRVHRPRYRPDGWRNPAHGLPLSRPGGSSRTAAAPALRAPCAGAVRGLPAPALGRGLPQPLAAVPRDPAAGLSAQRQDRLPLPQAPRARAVSVGGSAVPPHGDQGALRTPRGVLAGLAQGSGPRRGAGLPADGCATRSRRSPSPTSWPRSSPTWLGSERASGSMPG